MNHYSPTQLKLFRRCKRKWFYTYIMGFRGESTPAQEFGTLIHAQIENFYLTGELPENERALFALAVLPPRHESIFTEVQIKTPLFSEGSPEFWGYIDLLDVRDKDNPEILDYKTMKNFDYALTEHDLAEDVQMLMYGHHVTTLYPNAHAYSLAHVQIPTLGSELPRKVMTTVSTEHLNAKWAEFMWDVHEMEIIREGTSAADVEPNLDACWDYGGCPHKTRCMSAWITQEDDMSKLNTLNETLEVEIKGPSKSRDNMFKARVIGQQVKNGAKEGMIEYLFIDAVPVGNTLGNDMVTLSSFLDPIVSRIATETGIPDWRLHEFGKGKGFLAAGIRKAVYPRVLLVRSDEDAAKVALEVLMPLAKHIIQGV